MARYSIWVREYGSDHDTELMQVDSNPEAITRGLAEKYLTVKRSLFQPGARKVKVRKYSFIRIVDHDAR